ncbi:TetR/AcrR family transcriptional regulator [Variovorax sp. RHLX14]|uniref:TetR/AcrR family transcriptional regulator n=1 Tax=Variovorax sp. RHLX14 TaxID=1259731 RepID=UPI003F476076
MSRKKAAAPAEDVPPAESAPRRSKSDLTRERLLKAAAKVVARHGYTGASSARIGEEAGVAAGVLYYHFQNRSGLLDEILPTMGLEMVEFVAQQVKGMPWGVEREVQGFLAYLRYLQDNPEFHRVFREANTFAPKAYERHFSATLDNFELMLQVQRRKGHLRIEEADIRYVAYLLIGMRDHVSQLYMKPELANPISIEHAAHLYRQLLSEGFFRIGDVAELAREALPRRIEEDQIERR